MAYPSFRDLRVYQEALALTAAIYSISREGELARDFGLKDQMRRAAVSVAANIAEGYDRGTDREFIRFLYISKSSVTELQAHLDICRRLSMIHENTFVEHNDQCEKIKAMLIKLIRARRKAA